METIERNARLQTRLIDDLLDVSRIITGNSVWSCARSILLRIEVARDTVHPCSRSERH
jgi:hypothetical protein